MKQAKRKIKNSGYSHHGASRIHICGGEGMIYTIFSRGRTRYKAMCGNSVECCGLFNDWLTPEEARDGWNKRYETS